MKSTDYLNAVKEKLGIKSDYELARKLGLSKQAISSYQKGDRIIDDYAAAKIAEVLGKEPIEVIAIANMEREKASERREFWKKIATSSAKNGIVITLLLSVSYVNFLASDFVYYVKS